jgi:hypothetical protein
MHLSSSGANAPADFTTPEANFERAMNRREGASRFGESEIVLTIFSAVR